MPASLTASMADFVARLRYDDLPLDVVQQAKYFLLDAMGCALAAYKEDARKAAIASGMARMLDLMPESTVIGGGKTHASFAALANGMLINAADNDDTHKRALLHIGSVVVPAALAAVEVRDGSGRDLIVALVAGYEVAARVGMAVMPTHYRFWHSTATNGTFGAAAAAANARGFDAADTCAALGFAGTQAAGLNTFFESGDDSKSLHPGKAAMNGLLSVELVAQGAVAPPDVLGHAKGYLAAFSQEPKPEVITAGLGERWEVLQNAFKYYPSILASHSPIGASLEIVGRQVLDPGRIASVQVRTYATVKTHFSSKDVRTTMAARLSVPYCVAAALVDGKVTQEQFAPARYQDPVIRGLLKKVEIVDDPDLSPLYPERFPARVIVTLDDGSSYEATFMYPKGDPNNPLSRDELIAKFRSNVADVLPDAQAGRLLSAVLDLENVTAGTLAGCMRL